MSPAPRAVVMVEQLWAALGEPNVADPRPPSARWAEALQQVERLREALRLTEEEQRAYDDWRHITRHGNVPSVIVLLDALDRLAVPRWKELRHG